jgi:hypothetical protein
MEEFRAAARVLMIVPAAAPPKPHMCRRGSKRAHPQARNQMGFRLTGGSPFTWTSRCGDSDQGLESQLVSA